MKIIQKFALVVTTLVSSTLLNAVPVVQEWYVPQPEAQLRTDYLVLAPSTSTSCESVIAVTVPIAGTKIVFDHWEDGYEVDLGNPTQSTTEIWGDGNTANGKPPGAAYITDPAFTAGSVVTMRNTVPLPRNAATILYDGRDRLGSTQGIVMTRAGWFSAPGPLLANSVEVRAVPDWGTDFELPIGEDVIFPTPLTSSMFEHCSAYIMAAANGTVVTIDVNGPAVAGGVTTVTLNQGESYLVNSGILMKAAINATKPIQVIEFFGDIGANYESRGANIPPTNKWSDDYYAPVGTASDGDDTYIFLHNPDDSVAITVNYQTKTGTGSFSIPSETTYRFLMPQDSAARFTSVGSKPFWGIGTVGAEPTANNVHDWGYSLVPKDFLSTEIVVGWGAGSSDGTQNGSPVWITTVGTTTLYVDYNGDRLGGFTDVKGGQYDYKIDVTPMTVTRLWDPDKDQSGMRIYTLNGVLMTGAWGQDPASAGPAMPYLDLGNTLPNFPVPVLSKTSSLYTDANSNGIPNIGDVLQYTLTLDNRSLFSLSGIGLLDTLPTSYVSYVAGSTTRDGSAVADAGITPFPLDEGGLVVPILQFKATTVIRFRVTITAAGTAVNTALVVGAPGVEASNTVVIPSSSSFTTCTIKLTNNAGTEVDYAIGDGVYVTVTDADTNASASTVESITAVVQNSITNDTELITLTETGANTGIFRNTSALPTSTSTGLGPNDGTLNVAAGTTISASRLDPVFGDTCSDTATITAASGLFKQLYMDTDGNDVDSTGSMDRIAPGDETPADTILSQTPLLAGPAAGTIAISGLTTSGGSGDGTAATSLSFAHTPGSGSNRLMIVAVATGSSDNNATQGAVTGVTFNGIGMTLVGSIAAGAGSNTNSYIYSLMDSGINTTGQAFVEITATSSTIVASATTFSGVNQTTPLGTYVGRTSSGTALALSSSYSSASGEWVFSIGSIEQGDTDRTITTGTANGQTQLWEIDNNRWVNAATSYMPGAATVSPTYSASDSRVWTIGVVSIKPAAAGAGGTATFTQSPAFADTFSISAGGSIQATNYVEVPSGTLGGIPAITATLKNGASTIATLTNPSATLISGGSSSVVAAATSQNSSANTTSLSFSHNPGSGSNRLLLVAVGLGAITDTGNPPSMTGVTFGGTAMTLVGSRISGSAGTSDDTISYIYSMVNPPSGAANVVVTLGGAGSLVAGATTFTGVNQASPLGTLVSAAGSGATASVAVTSASGQLVFGTSSWDEQPPVTVPVDQSSLWNITGGALGAASGAASTEPGASSVTHSYTSAGNNQDWAILAVPIQPAVSSAIYRLDWSATAGSIASFNSGESVVLTVANAGESGFRVLYDSSDYPSKITLPTNTVIHADTVAVYDAAYPNGSVVTTPTVGQTLYVRATIGDPFGYEDVTSASLAIDGISTIAGDIASAAMTPVAGSGAVRTFEYVWVTGSTEDIFNLTVTAKEGFENTITSTKSTSIPLTALDLGTPSTTEFTTGNNGLHTLTYAPDEMIYVRVIDFDENANPLVAETVTVVIVGSGGDSETVTLTETGLNTGIFTGGVPASSTVPGTSNNGTLYAVLGSIPVVNYVDNDDALDTGSDTALIPNTIANVSVTKTLLTDNPILIGEAVQYRLRVTNTGNTTLTTVQVVDTFPTANLTYVSSSPVENSVASGSPNSTITWTNVGPLIAGQSVDILVNFTGLAAAAPATNTVNVTTGGGPTASDAEPVTITRPALTVTKTLHVSTPGPVNKGDNVIFNISVENTGTTAITSLPLEDLFSNALFEYVSAEPTPDGVGAGSLLWNDLTGAGSLAVSGILNVTVTLKAKGASTAAPNTAAVNYAVDANNDPVPPSSDDATVEIKAASISGYVLEDRGSAGFGGGDVGLAGVTVVLYTDPNADDNESDGVVVAITTTDANGYYEFLNLPLGEYVVVQQDLLGYSSISDTQAPNDNRIGLNVSTFTSYPNNNFLDDVVDPANFGGISGQVRNDTDADADFGDADGGLTGAVVTLYTDPNGDGDPSDGVPYGSAVTTTASGNYAFTLLPPGYYVVVETDPSGFVSTADVINPNDNWIPVTVVASTTASGKNFLDTNTLVNLGIIGNQVWSDADNDGIFDGGESGISGLTVELYLSTQTPGVDSPYLITTTGVGGTYQFTNVPVGSYLVSLPTPPVTAPLSSTTTPTGNNNDNGLQTGGTGTRVVTGPFTLTAGGIDNSKDLGLVPVASLVALGNRIFNDIDGDGILDSGETGIPSVTVNLYLSGDTPGTTTPRATAVTDAQGFYYFDNLVAGTYFVHVPAAEFQVGGDLHSYLNPVGTYPDDNKDHGIYNSAPATNGISSTTLLLAAGTMPTTENATGYTGIVPDANTNFTLDLAFVGPANQVSIGNLIFQDTNNDGNRDPGEPGINGVVVELWRAGTGPGGIDELDESATTATLGGEAGSFVFEEPPGTYYVKIIASNFQSGGALISIPRTSSAVLTGNDQNHGSQAAGPGTVATSAPITLSTGQSNMSQDFGFVPVASLVAFGNRIFTDVNGNGQFDSGTDSGVSGVDIQLYAQGQTAGVSTPLATVTTDSSGYYYFNNLAAGTYFAHVPAAEFQAGGPLLGSLSSGGASSDFGLTGDGYDHGVDGLTPASSGISTALVLLSLSNGPLTEISTGYTGSVPDPNTYFVGDFGFVPSSSLATLSGTVRLDTTFDNTADGHIDGVTVKLYADNNSDGFPDGAALFTQVTDSSGAYSFTGLTPGSYVVVESDPTGYYSISDGDSTTPGDDTPSNISGIDNRIPVTVAAAESDTGNDFLDRGLGTIGNSVWLDENSDGIQAAGELAVRNASVSLTGTDISGNTVNRTTVTSNGSSNYIFSGLPPSNGSGYTITVTPLAHLSQTYDENGLGTPNATTVVLAAGGEHLTADFGYNWAPTANVTGGTGTGAIGNLVWIDANANGSRDPGESGLGGVTVSIYYDSNNDGVVDSIFLGAVDQNGVTGTGTTTTNSDGSYVFHDLPKGIYEIVGTPPSGYTQTGDPDATLDNQTTAPILLAPGDVYVNADFGYQPTAGTSGTVSGTIWLDADADSTGPAGTPGGTDTSELTMQGVTVVLIKDLDGDGVRDSGEPIIARAVTDASGNFSFPGLPVIDGVGTDDYLVWLTDTEGINSGGIPTYDADGTSTLNLSAARDLTAAGDSLQDFGYTLQDSTPTDAGAGGIGDTVFLDRNNDGIIDLGEGLEGVRVDLFDAAGATSLATFFTNENGNYYFNGLVGATYTVRVDTSTLPGTTGQLTNTVDPDSGGALNESIVTITGSNTNLLQDFGYQDLSNPNTIEGTIWNDRNADGVLSDESGVHAGVTLALIDSLGHIVATTTTDGSGNYTFSGVPDGSFTVDVTDAANVLDGLWHSQGVDQAQATDNSSKADPYSVTLSGNTIANADFGYYGGPASLGNWVWNDLDLNGVQDSGESGLAGVVVQLTITWPDATTTHVKTVTNASGYYYFDNLLLDENFDGTGVGEPTYSISIPTQPGTASPTGAGTAETDSNLATGATAVASEGTLSDIYDFGFYNTNLYTANISGTVYDDGGPAVASPGNTITGDDTPQGGVIVSLYFDLDSSGTADPGELVGIAVTAMDGTYSFPNLANGNYLVIETDPAGASSEYDPSGTADDNTIAVTLTGSDVSGRDFLDDGAIVSPISGHVYDDGGFGVIGDTQFGGLLTDATVPGVIVKLYRDLNNDGLDTTNELVAATATDAYGYYTFGSLPNGAYLVIEVDPTGATSVLDTDAGTDPKKIDNKIAVTLVGSSIGGNDFLDDSGTSTHTYTVSGTVYNDANHDWAFNGDTALETVTVRLYADLNNNGVFDSGDVQIDTKTTNASGDYAFVNLPDGDYLVVETDLDGYNSVTDSGEPDAANNNNTIDVRVSGGDSTGNNFLDFLQACPDQWANWKTKWSGLPYSILIDDLDPADNPDGDRYNNLVEYAFCLPPNSGIKKPFCLTPGTPSGTIDGVYRRTAGGTTDVTYYLQSKATLNGVWSEPGLEIVVGSNATAVNMGDGTEEVTVTDLEAETKTNLRSGEGFVRMKVVLASPATTAYAEVLGWTETTLNQACSTYNNPYLRCSSPTSPSFSGTVDVTNPVTTTDPTAQTINFVTSAGGADLGSLLESGYSYYLEVTSGDNVGQRYDVAAASDSAITVANDANLYAGTAPFNTALVNPGLLPDSLAADTVVLRRHWRLADQFPVSGFYADPGYDKAKSDQVQIYADGAWTSYYLRAGTPAKWVLLTDNSYEDQGPLVTLPPGQGMFVSKPQSAVNVLMYGEVRQNAFIRPLQITDATGRANLVGGGFPIDQKATGTGSREMTRAGSFNSFFGSRDFKKADSFFVWKGDATNNPSVDGYDSYFRLYSTSPGTADYWAKVGDPELVDDTILNTRFLSDRSVFIRVQATKDTYTIPCPWAP